MSTTFARSHPHRAALRGAVRGPALQAVKAWKAAVPGRKAIGYMPVYVPRELIHAAGMLPVGILGGGDQLEVIQGDAYYQSYICRIPRSTIELGLTGRLDCLDGMLFPSICDVIRNLSGMWQILFKDKYVRYVDVPQNYQDEVGGVFYQQEMQHIRDDLGTMRGSPITDAELNASIAVYNDNRAGHPRPVRLPRRQALAGPDLRGLPAAARRHGAAGGGAHAAGARLPGRGRAGDARPSATTRAWSSTAASASSRRWR
jgi:benzoyl-CoA reductase/2-hydroxyglutaryl-CoA dehydratase subunit BcrC/BadD/HgdB